MNKPNNIAAYLTYAWRCIDRVLFALIVFPATAFFLFTLVVGGMSFDGVARAYYEISAETPVVSTNPTTFSVRACTDPKFSTESSAALPSTVRQQCSHWEQRTKSLEELAISAGGSLRIFYFIFVVAGVVALIVLGRLPKWPEPPVAP